MEAPSRSAIARFLVPAALGLLLALPPATSFAAGPTEEVRKAIDAVIGILGRPGLKGDAGKEERRALLRKQIAPVFDFREMAKRSLGVSWRGRTAQEQDEFAAVFRELLESSYLGKIEAYKGEKILYVKEKIDGQFARVGTVVVTSKGQEHPVDYLMLRDGDRWRIYDVAIEGISLVNNYRSQFAEIIRRSSFDDLLGKLRAAAARMEGA